MLAFTALPGPPDLQIAVQSLHIRAFRRLVAISFLLVVQLRTVLVVPPIMAIGSSQEEVAEEFGSVVRDDPGAPPSALRAPRTDRVMTSVRVIVRDAHGRRARQTHPLMRARVN